MTYLVQEAKNQLTDILQKALNQAFAAGTLPETEMPAFSLEVPAERTHGDWSCNIAMTSARVFRNSPVKIATIIVQNTDLAGTYFTKCEVAGPGFLNFFYDDLFYAHALNEVHQKGEDYGKSDFGGGETVLVEFVSANPTGPMHIGNARGGALGDCLSAVLQTAGFEVSKEFYVNDAGNQLEKLGLSLDIRYQQLFDKENAPEMPEDSYHGEDIIEHVKNFVEEHGDSLLAMDEKERRKTLTSYVLPKNVARMQNDLARYGIYYDRWFFESELHKDGSVNAAIEILKDKGLTYSKDGALWYKATDLGGEKDEVIIRSNGNPTYFIVDVAYHLSKFNRGFSLLIDCLGADHHGHVSRMKTAMNAVGKNGDKLEVLLYQLVNLVRNGETVRMSKRTGKAIQLADLLDEVSKDSVRFTFNTHEPNIAMDFDLDLAVKQDAQNPLYYVQYAHARICSILRNLAADNIQPRACSNEELTLLQAPEERALIRHISIYTDEIIRCASKLDPSGITRYVINLATLFHKFYNACRVKGENESLMQARISLCLATQTVIKNVLEMFHVNVPETM
ncbi:arginine--tRNA ligase [Scatolibacter rhodanostii]|uniref:arginine--tRNA ligase n=1 Tax=Scatolibacter rhodanostii TaxID=2014781 RepID=UPI000C0770F0|nr:arginine--tRNA ligase [Scatolibacter rhodanostii]